METTKNKYSGILVFLCSAVYFVSYLTRINYAAVMVEITKSLNISKTAASLALTASAISYGFGQIVSGYLGDKFKPEKIIVSGLICTSLMNLLIPLTASPGYMTAIWFVNGLAQAMMWPPMVKIMTSMLNDEEYKKGCIKVFWGSSTATIFIYIAAPFIIHISSWKFVFVFSAACAVLMCIFWIFGYSAVKKNLTVKAVSKKTEGQVLKEHFSPKVFFLLIFIMITVAIQGSLRDGVTNWMPSYISESFNLGSEISILTNVFLPIFSLFIYSLTSYLNRRFIKNEYLCIAFIYAVGALCALILALFGNIGAGVAVFAAAILSGAMHGVNYCQTCLTPMYFARYGKVSLISGVINSGTYIGSAISTYGVAYLAQSLAWEQIAVVWCLAALFGGVLAFGISGKWNKFKNEQY